MPDDGKSGFSDAQALAKDFLGILGLPEIVLGAFGLYVAWLNRAGNPDLQWLFRSTGSHAIDFALVIAFAALVGKCLTLFAAIIMAFAALRIEHSEYYKVIRAELGGLAPTERWNILDLAATAAAIKQRALSKQIEAVRTESIFAFGASIELVVFSYFSFRQSFTAGLFTVAAAALLVVLGYLKYADYVASLANALILAQQSVGSLSQME